VNTEFRVIDVHHHVMPRHHYDDLSKYIRNYERLEPFLGKGGLKGYKIMRGDIPVWIPNEKYVDINQQVRDMDRTGVDVAVLSIGAWQEWNRIDICSSINDSIAKMVDQYPNRFIGLAHIPICEEAVDELDRAVKDLGLRGVCITTHYDGMYPDEEIYLPLYRKINELGIPVFIHPAATPPDPKYLNKYGLSPTLGRVFDNGLVTCRILFSGVMDKFQNLKFIISHLGGSFLFVNSYPNLTVVSGNYKHDWMKRLFFDTAPALHHPKLVEAAIHIVGVDQILFGSDYPAIVPDLMERGVELINRLNVSDRDKSKIFWENAARLFGLRQD